MIEAIMFSALGFLAASLIALVLLSAVWHRAVRLTTRRIEGAIPVSMAEIQADKDQLRAEFRACPGAWISWPCSWAR